MNREQVIRMAREACAPEWWDEGTGFHMGLDLARFAALVEAAEREKRKAYEMMAECMDMVRQELIQAGVISKEVPPMMVGDAVVAAMQSAVAAERRKHQGEIEHWKAKAAQAEKWRALALIKDPMQPGKIVQEIQREAMEVEREACAQECESVDLHDGDFLKYSDPRKTCAAAVRARSSE